MTSQGEERKGLRMMYRGNSRTRTRRPDRRGSAWTPVAALLLLFLASQPGCGVAARTRSLFGGDLKMAVMISPELNQNAPVAVDLVVVYDKALVKKLQELSAREWFLERDQLLRDFPKGFDRWGWEWVPGQEVPEQTMTFRLGASGAFLFADYLGPGAHRQAVDPHEHFLLELGTDSFSVSPLKRN